MSIYAKNRKKILALGLTYYGKKDGEELHILSVEEAKDLWLQSPEPAEGGIWNCKQLKEIHYASADALLRGETSTEQGEEGTRLPQDVSTIQYEIYLIAKDSEFLRARGLYNEPHKPIFL